METFRATSNHRFHPGYKFESSLHFYLKPFYDNHKTGGTEGQFAVGRSAIHTFISVDMNLQLKTSREAFSYHLANSSESQGIDLNMTSCLSEAFLDGSRCPCMAA